MTMKEDINRLKVVLAEQKRTNKWLAEQLGKSFAMVNAYVGNHRQPSLDMIAQIADILQVEPIDLIVFVDKKVKN